MEHCYHNITCFIEELEKQGKINEKKQKELLEILMKNQTPVQDYNHMCYVAQLWFSLEKELIECFQLTFREGTIVQSSDFSFQLEDSQIYCYIKQTKSYIRQQIGDSFSPQKQVTETQEVKTDKKQNSKINVNGSLNNSKITSQTTQQETDNQVAQHSLDQNNNNNQEEIQLQAILKTIYHIQQEESELFQKEKTYVKYYQERDNFLKALVHQNNSDQITEEIKQCLQRFKPEKYDREYPLLTLTRILVQIIQFKNNSSIFKDTFQLKYMEGLKCNKCGTFYQGYYDDYGGYKYNNNLFELGLDYNQYQYLTLSEIIHTSPFHNSFLHCSKCNGKRIHAFERECTSLPKILILKKFPLDPNLLKAEDINVLNMISQNLKVKDNIQYSLIGACLEDSNLNSIYLRKNQLIDRLSVHVNSKPLYLIYKRYITS